MYETFMFIDFDNLIFFLILIIIKIESIAKPIKIIHYNDSKKENLHLVL